MNYLTPEESYWACDIEANGFRKEASRIHCVCVENILLGETESFTDRKEFNQWLRESPRVLVGHNFMSYDAPVLNRLWQTRIKARDVIDTFLLSMIFSPSLKGGHSLADWGVRLNDHKIEFNEFETFTPEMLTYCQQDVSLTARVYRALSDKLRREGFSERGIELEHLAWNILQNKQKVNGFPFDQEKADLLYSELRAKEERLKEEIYKLWPPVYECVRTFASGYKKDGTRTISYLRHLGQYPELRDLPDGRYEAWDYTPFDLGSPKQRIDKLLELGWEPVNFTKTGQAQIDEDSLLAFAESSGHKEAKALAEWLVCNARANMIKTWSNSIDSETGHIHGSLFLASTGRYRHSSPNTANIPGNEAVYGSESRSLWTSGGSEWSLVGIDAKGIQLRILAHYLNNPDFSSAILSDDPHTENQKRMGLPSRALTKTITYATLMSAGVQKIADTAKVPLKEAQAARQKFFSQVPELPSLISRLQKELASTGRITACDGTKYSVSSDHMVIPYLLQADESRLMKQTMIYIDEEIRKRGWQRDVLFVGMVHDELQIRVRRELVDAFVSLALPCFNRAGESFNYRIIIEGDAKVGNAWHETH